MSEAAGIVSASGTILYYNKVALQYQPLLTQPLQAGVSIHDIVPIQYRDLMRFIFNDIARFNKPQHTELVIPNPSGQPFFFDVNFLPLPNGADTVCVMARDITSQKIFEKKSARLVAELSDLIENANALIFAVDAQAFVTVWNKECARITGFRSEDVLARKLDFLFEQQDAETVSGLLARVFNGESIGKVECRIRSVDARTLTLLLSINPKVSSAGKVIGALFVAQDITELTQYRHALERNIEERTKKLVQSLQKEKELVELKNKFVSIASHEFKIPLRAISASVGFLRNRGALTADGEQRLSQIDGHVKHMKALLDDVLTLGKNENPAIEAKRAPVDLIAFLKHAMMEISDATGHTHIFVTEFTRSEVLMESDEKLLRNIFLNLLGNAVKFSPANKEVLVKVMTTDDRVIVTIQDFGIGIAEEELGKVFVPFNRGSNTAGIKGTGLGLSIVKKAVDTLQGSIEATSKMNAGTTFTVSFKLPKL